MDIARLGLRVDASGAITSVKQLGTELDRLGTKGEASAKKVSATAASLQTAFKAAAGSFAVLAAVGAFERMIRETIEAQRVQAQLAAVLKSTGGAAGQTIDDLNAMSAALQRTTAYSDDAVGSAQALLLTFTNIKGSQIFEQTTKAVLDMAQAMGTDLKSQAIQVGKALNDPIQGLGALSRVGVQFSESQKEVIKHMVETNHVADAQALILKELEKEFGGSAEAARGTLGGALQGLKNAFGDLFEETEKNTAANARLLNSFTHLFGKMKEIREANIARLHPADPLDYFRNEKDPGATGKFYSGGTTVISAHAPTETEKQAAADAKAKSAREALAAATHYAAEKEREYAFAREQTAKAEEDLARILARHSQNIIDQRNERSNTLLGGANGITATTQASVSDAIGIATRNAAKATDDLAKHFGDLSGASAKAAQVISQAIEYYVVQKVGGGGAGANFGASIAKGAFSDLAGGFAKTALGASIFAPIVAGAGAALGSLIDFGAGNRAAAEALKQMTDAAKQSALSFKIQAQGFTSLQDEKDQAAIEHAKRLADFQKLPAGSERNTRISEEFQNYQRLIERIERDDAEKKQAAGRDLEVRALRASDKTREADALEFANRQAAEIFAAQAQGMSDEYLARLKVVQGMEKEAAARDKLTTSLLNVPPGFKYNDLVYQASPSQPFFNPPTDIPYTPKNPGMPPKRGISGDLSVVVDVPVSIQLDGSTITTVVLRNLKGRAQRQYGNTARWGEIQ